MTLSQLSCFRAFVEERSVTEAARRLGVTQPAVSQQLQQLSEALGCDLYHRHGSKFTLTAEGWAAYERAKRILTELDLLEDDIRSRDGNVVGTVRIGSGQVAAKTVLSDTIQAMMTAHPRVSFSLVETHSSALPDLIRHSRVDLGIGILPRADRGLRLQQLLSGRLLLICSSKHELSARRSISRHELKNLSLIRHSREHTTRIIAYELYGEDRVAGNFQLEVMNTETIIHYVQRDMGVALASSYAIAWLNPSDIATIEIEESADIPWGVISDAARPLSAAARVFVETLKQQFPADAGGEPHVA